MLQYSCISFYFISFYYIHILILVLFIILYWHIYRPIKYSLQMFQRYNEQYCLSFQWFFDCDVIHSNLLLWREEWEEKWTFKKLTYWRELEFNYSREKNKHRWNYIKLDNFGLRNGANPHKSCKKTNFTRWSKWKRIESAEFLKQNHSFRWNQNRQSH